MPRSSATSSSISLSFETTPCTTLSILYEESGESVPWSSSTCRESHSVRKSGLKPATRYEITISATNRSGATATRQLWVTPLPAELPALRPAASAIDANNIQVSFTTSVCGVAKFRTTTNDGVRRGWHEVAGCNTRHSFVFGRGDSPRLKPGTSYSFEVSFTATGQAAIFATAVATTPRLALVGTPRVRVLSANRVDVTFVSNGCGAGDFSFSSADGTDRGTHVGSNQLPAVCWVDHVATLGDGVNNEPLEPCTRYTVNIVLIDQWANTARFNGTSFTTAC